MTSRLRDFANFSKHEKPTVGDIKMSMYDKDHTGWLKCDGRSIDKYLYNQLFQTIGYKYGGSNLAFNLPNPKGRVLGVIGAGPGLTERTQGDTVGEEKHQLVEAELPDLTLTSSDNGAHTHTHNCNGGVPGNSLSSYTGQNTQNGSVNPSPSEPDLYAAPVALTINNAANHNHTVTFGDNVAHNNMQPTMFVGNMFIYCGRPNVGTYPYTFKGYKYYQNPGTR